MKQKVTNIAVPIITILICFVCLLLLAGKNPLDGLRVFFISIFGSVNGIAEACAQATPLLLCSLGIALSYRTGYFNCGGEGQICMGALASAIVALNTQGIPSVFRIILAMVFAMAAGGLWSLIPALLKRSFGISEVITGIMLNYVATMVVGVMLRGPLQEPGSIQARTRMFDAGGTLPKILGATRLDFGFIIALLAFVVTWFIIKKTKVGYEMRVTGLNVRAAYCGGVPTIRTMFLAALFSGGFCALAGVEATMGVHQRLLEGITGNNGWNGIMVALLADNDPVMVLIISFIIGGVQAGANGMKNLMGIPSSIVSILLGVLVIVVLFKEFRNIFLENRKTRAAK